MPTKPTKSRSRRLKEFLCRVLGHNKEFLEDAILDEVVGWKCKRCGASYSHVRGHSQGSGSLLLLALFLLSCNLPSAALVTPTITATPFFPATQTVTPTATETLAPTPAPCTIGQDEFIERAVVGSTDFVITGFKVGTEQRVLEDVVLYGAETGKSYIMARGFELQFNGQSEIHTTIDLFIEPHALSAPSGSNKVVVDQAEDWIMGYTEDGQQTRWLRAVVGNFFIEIKLKHYQQADANDWLLAMLDILKEELSCEQ